VDRTIILDQHHRVGRLAGLGTIKPIQLLKVGDEVAAALGWAGVHDELACDVIEGAHHRDLLGLARCRHTQIRPRPGPDARKIGMRQRLAFVAIEQNNVSGFSVLSAQLQTQANPFDLLGGLASPQRVPRSSPTELFLRSALDNCDRLMRTPSRVSISARSRGMVQLRRSATGFSSKDVTTRKAASLFTGAGPGATLAVSAPDAAAHEIAAPQADRVFAHPERLGNPRAGPTGQRQQHGAGPVRLAAITRASQGYQSASLFLGCRERRFSSHALHLRIGAVSESDRKSLVNQPDPA